MEEQAKAICEEIDLKEYYEIKRPTVVMFHYDQNGNGKGEKQMKVVRYDILSETQNESIVKMVNFN